jgi:hypothetical protein
MHLLSLRVSDRPAAHAWLAVCCCQLEVRLALPGAYAMAATSGRPGNKRGPGRQWLFSVPNLF